MERTQEPKYSRTQECSDADLGAGLLVLLEFLSSPMSFQLTQLFVIRASVILPSRRIPLSPVSQLHL